MDKRRLSAIPREEATADMVEIAGRLGKMKHAVTARLIENNKILLLHFYEVSKLKKGKTEAVFRTFLSEDDYITQDLKQSKVKWLTASFYNMDGFDIIESHYNSKKGGYDREERVFIRSNEEQKIIGDFFKKYEAGEKHRYGGVYPYPWEAVRNFQEAVLERKLKEKHSRELKKVDEAMEPFKEKPPQEFFDWMWETGMSFARYVIYKEVEKDKAECECTHCGKIEMVSRKEIRLRNNEKGLCPFCGSPVTFKARGKLAWQTRSERWFIYVDPTPEGFALRYFSSCRILRNDDHIKSSLQKKRLEEWSHELSRAIYTFPNGKPHSVDYEWSVYKQRGSSRWCPYNRKWQCSDSILYPGNLPAAWEHTPMKYSALEILASNIPTVALDYERGIKTHIEFPKLEWLCKMGLNNLAKFVINEGHRSHSSLGKINYKGNTIYEILGLTKINTKIMQEIDGTNAEQRLLQVAQEIGYQFKAEQLREYYNTFECNTELLKQSNRKVSLHKLVKYISKESEKYPIGANCGCWMYSYHRYQEREDPRIERKQNMARDWLEYLKWCKALGYDLDNMFIYMPKNFKAVHDRTAAEYQALQDKKAADERRRREAAIKRAAKQTEKALAEILEQNGDADAFSIKGKGLVLIVPKDGDEIRAEGAALHHCVGGYVERVAKGETSIFFIRKAEEPEKPYFTMEWKNNDIVQCRGSHNCGMPPEVKAFTQAFKKKMLDSINNDKKKQKARRCG